MFFKFSLFFFSKNMYFSNPEKHFLFRIIAVDETGLQLSEGKLKIITAKVSYFFLFLF